MRTILFVNTMANDYGGIGTIIKNYANLFPNDKIISTGAAYDDKDRVNFPKNVETIKYSDLKGTIICDIVFFTMNVDFKLYEQFIPINVPKILMFHIDISNIKDLPISVWYDYNFYANNVENFDAVTVSSPSYIPIAKKLFPEVDVLEFKNYTNFSKVKEGSRDNFLYVGRIAKNSKNTFELIKIAKLLRNENIKIDVYGSGTDEKLFKKKVQEENLENIISIKGHLDHELVLPTICQYKALLNTSYLECFPYVALEAFFTNTPVIAYNCSPGLCDILSDNRGILIDDGDFNSYAKALSHFNSQKINYQSMQQYILDFSFERLKHQVDFFIDAYKADTIVILDEYTSEYGNTSSSLTQFVENNSHTKFVVLYNPADGFNEIMSKLDNVKMHDYRIHDEYHFYIMEEAKYIINANPHLIQKVPAWIKNQLLIHNHKTMHLYFGSYEDLYENFDSFISYSQIRQSLENSFITKNIFVKNRRAKEQLSNILESSKVLNLPNFINVKAEENYDLFDRNDLCYIIYGNSIEKNIYNIFEIAKNLDENIKINVYGEFLEDSEIYKNLMQNKIKNVKLVGNIEQNNIVQILAKHKALISITPLIDYASVELEVKLTNTPCIFYDTPENLEKLYDINPEQLEYKLFARRINKMYKLDDIPVNNYKYNPATIARTWNDVFESTVGHYHFEKGITFIVDNDEQNLIYENYQIIGTKVRNYSTKIKFNKITRLFELPSQEKIEIYVDQSKKNSDVILFDTLLENIHLITLYNSICSVEPLLDNAIYLNYNASKYIYDTALSIGLRWNTLSIKQNELNIDLKYLSFEKMLVHSWFCNELAGIKKEDLFTKRTLVNKENALLYEQYCYILRRREKNVFI